jgi:hypothetical protein
MREDRARAEAARAAEDKQRADAAKAAAAARTAEEARAAEFARQEELARQEAAAQAAPTQTAPAPDVIVHMPEEAGDPQGPWVNPIAEAPKQNPAPESPPEVSVNLPQEAGEPPGPWVDPIRVPAAPAPKPEAAPVVTVITPAATNPPAPAAPTGPAAPPSAPPAPSKPAPAAPVTGQSAGQFLGSANIITELEKGKYYVQLGAYRSAASIESALLKIDPGYPLKVQPSGSADNPLYRLLVGPVNLGESGALVQRFKGSGYRDAYVRSN